MPRNPFSQEARVRALYGKAAHIADVCGKIISLNTRLVWPDPNTAEGQEALARREPFDRARREYLGAWLANASPEDLRALADWRDRPEWPGPEDEIGFGIQLATLSKAVQEAVAATGFQVLPQASLPENPSPSPPFLLNVKAMGPAEGEFLSNEELRKALAPDNQRDVLTRMSAAELQSSIKDAQMGNHTEDAIRKVRKRKFKATRKGPGRPPKPK